MVEASPPPPQPPFMPGACQVWAGRCIRPGGVLGTQFYAFLALFVLGAVLIVRSVASSLSFKSINDVESEALTASNCSHKLPGAVIGLPAAGAASRKSGSQRLPPPHGTLSPASSLKRARRDRRKRRSHDTAGEPLEPSTSVV